MLSERDRNVVMNMVKTGMALETLKTIFKQFDEKDIEKCIKTNTEAIMAIQRVFLSVVIVPKGA